MRIKLIALGLSLTTIISLLSASFVKAEGSPSGTLTVSATGQSVAISGNYSNAVDWGTVVSWGDGASVAYPGFSGNIADSHYYANSGTYNIVLEVWGDSDKHTSTHTVSVGGNPTGSLAVTLLPNREVKVDVDYNYAFDWGTTVYWGHDNSLVSFPGNSGSYDGVSHQFPGTGTYTVSLVVEGQGGPFVTTKEVVISDPDTSGGIEVVSTDPAKREASIRVNHTNSFDWGTTVYWGHDNSLVSFPNTSGSNTVTHQFPRPGRYTVNLVVEGPGGTKVYSQEFAFDVNVGAPSATLDVQVTDAATRTVTATASYQNSYDWGSNLYWGHSDSSINFPGFNGTYTVTHQFPRRGTYEVSFVVEGDGGPVVLTRSVSFFN